MSSKPFSRGLSDAVPPGWWCFRTASSSLSDAELRDSTTRLVRQIAGRASNPGWKPRPIVSVLNDRDTRELRKQLKVLERRRALRAALSRR